MHRELDSSGLAEESEASVKALQPSDAWLAAQKEAFQAAMDGAPLEISLGILIRVALEQVDGGRRCAFYIANSDGTELQHVVGMTEDYARRVRGFKIGPESLACGLAVHTRQAVITPDVLDEPRWKPWLWLAKEHGYRGCWSFPVETSTGKIVGSFAMYFTDRSEITQGDRELAAALAHPASIIISRHQEAQERARVTEALVQSQISLAAELAAARQLQSISTLLIQEGEVATLYRRIVEAAKDVMQSDMASIQILDRDKNALLLIAHVGFDLESETVWRWVDNDDDTSCGMALSQKRRIIIEDTEHSQLIAETAELAQYRRAGIRAMQSTPLLARSGNLLGMISTHWRKPHQPHERDFDLFDVLARQAADLIERTQSEHALKRLAEQLKLLLDELNHRVKNTLVIVQSMAMQTLRNMSDPADAQRRFESRLMALSQAHDILTQEMWKGALLHNVVEMAIAAYRAPGNDRFEIDGPSIWLSSKHALALAMALHELATNALKYGSLSNDTGRVRLEWERADVNGSECLQMSWTEVGGPAVRPPSRRGFGSRLIERGLKQDLGGEVEVSFMPSGLRCTIEAPLNDMPSSEKE
jgi:two-component sensor histidine kinase